MSSDQILFYVFSAAIALLGITVARQSTKTKTLDKDLTKEKDLNEAYPLVSSIDALRKGLAILEEQRKKDAEDYRKSRTTPDDPGPGAA